MLLAKSQKCLKVTIQVRAAADSGPYGQAGKRRQAELRTLFLKVWFSDHLYQDQVILASTQSLLIKYLCVEPLHAKLVLQVILCLDTFGLLY